MMVQFPSGCHVENKLICAACGGFSKGCCQPPKLVQDPVVDESTLRVLCKQYGINLDGIQSPNETVQSKKSKKLKRIKSPNAKTGDVEVNDQLNK